MTNTELTIKVSELEYDRYVIEIENKKYEMIEVARVTGGGDGDLSLVDFYYRCIPIEEGE
jgi:hypothetical protein